MLSCKDQDVLAMLFGSPPSSSSSSAPSVVFERTESEIASLELEKVAIAKAESGLLDEAEKDLSVAIDLHGSASAFNNRAQVRQFLKKEEAMSDLDTAISKAKTRGDQVTLRQALCQRGMLLRVKLRDEEARRDFEEAAALGSSLAKQQAVLLNPQAQLCADMVAIMFSEFHKKNN